MLNGLGHPLALERNSLRKTEGLFFRFCLWGFCGFIMEFLLLLFHKLFQTLLLKIKIWYNSYSEIIGQQLCGQGSNGWMGRFKAEVIQVWKARSQICLQRLWPVLEPTMWQTICSFLTCYDLKMRWNLINYLIPISLKKIKSLSFVINHDFIRIFHITWLEKNVSIIGKICHSFINTFVWIQTCSLHILQVKDYH